MNQEPSTIKDENSPQAEGPEQASAAFAASAKGRALAALKKLLFLILFGGLVGTSFGITIGLSRDLPQIVNLENFKPMLSSVVYSSDGRIIADFGIEKRQRTSLARIPPHLLEAFIAVEDQNFYSHFGIDPLGILRALIVDIRMGRMAQGGSTITQQLSRNLFLTHERNVVRKIREAILALQIERSYTKEQILELYLNQIYLGHGAYGVQEASGLYFGRPVQDLTLAQCAMLAALPKAPNYYSPKKNPSAARNRRNIVLGLMHGEGFITKEQYLEAKFEPIILEASTSRQTMLAPHFAEYVRRQLIDRYGYDMLYKGGLKVYTTIDLDMQKAAEAAVAGGLVTLDEKHGARAPEHTDQDLPREMLDARQAGALPQGLATEVVQAALVAIDPATGEIRAMVGGRDFEKSEFNRAVQARRQPGSGFKPIVWAAALEAGMTPSDRILDAPVVFHFRDKVWEPENYEERFYGPTTLREALEHSRNIVSIRLLKKIGIAPTIRLARKMGIKSYLQPNLSLALGSSGLSPLEIASAYATIVAGGIYRRPTAILKILGPDGAIIEESRASESIALSEQTAYLVTSLLEGVVTRGTGRRAVRALKRPAGGKTGTTNDCTDAWFVGFTPELAASVWVGFDDMRSLGKKQTGGRVAAPIWTEFMKAAHVGKPKREFDVPPGIVFVETDYRSGLLAGPDGKDNILSPFLEGTQPTKHFDPAEQERLHEDIMHVYANEVSF
jgi:penicillin-binding protein 1A